MFLDQVGALKLLQHDENTHILFGFALPVKRVVISALVNYIATLDDVTTKNLLITPAHVTWLMESIGAAFTLPMEDEGVINLSVDIYRKWIFDPEKCSKAIADDGKSNQIFLQNILEHISMIFATRKTYTEKESVDRHIKLCLKALGIFQSIGRDAAIRNSLTPTTWDIILKLLMGICDHLLTNKNNSNEDSLGNALSPQALKVFFELWLLSQNNNLEMWNNFSNLMNNKDKKSWHHTFPAIVQWNATCIGLTNRVLNLLYGPTEGFPTIAIKLDDTSQFDLDSNYIFYAWQRMFQLMGNPNNISEPRNFTECFKGIRNIVKLFLSIGANDKTKKVRAPDGNTILHIFGNWLFEAIKLNRTGYEEGTSLALDTICDIFFSLYNKTKFQPIYLATFYSCLSDVLLLKECRLSFAAVVACRHLFTYDLEGSRLMIPHLIFAISNVVTKTKCPIVDAPFAWEVIRESGIRLLGSMITYPNYFGTGPVQSQFSLRLTKEQQQKIEQQLQPEGKPAITFPDLSTYSALRPFLCQMILKVIKTELHAPNVDIILQTCVQNIHELFDEANRGDSAVVSMAESFAHNVIELVLGKISSLVAWPVKVSQTGLKMISSLPMFYPKLTTPLQEAYTVVSSLCKFILHLCSEPSNLSVDENDRLLVDCLYCVLDWIMVPPNVPPQDSQHQWLWSVNSNGTINNDKNSTHVITMLLNAITVSMGYKKANEQQSVRKASEEIKEACEFCLHNLFNLYGNFPANFSGMRSVSSLVNETQLIQGIESTVGHISDTRQYVRYFTVDNDAILSFADIPNTDGTANVVVIIRDHTGKYAWNTQVQYAPMGEKSSHVPTPAIAPCGPPPSPVTGRLMDDKSFEDLFAFLKNRIPADSIMDLTMKQMAAEKASLQSQKYGMNHSVQLLPPALPIMYNSDNKFIASRLLLSNFGLLTLESRDHVCQIEQTPAFFAMLQQLDGAPERFVTKIGLVYAAAEVTANSTGSRDFQEFVTGLGWGVPVGSHPGFLGGLDKTIAETAQYYATYSDEIVYHVLTNPNSESENHQKMKALISKAYVVIIWLEDELENYKKVQETIAKGAEMFILVRPLQTRSLYHIRIIIPSNAMLGVCVGPVCDNMILRKENLASLLRLTAVNANRKIARLKEGPLKPLLTRRRLIEEISQKFRRDENVSQFFGGLFQPIRDQLNPSVSASSTKSAVVGISEKHLVSSPPIGRSGTGGKNNSLRDSKNNKSNT